MLQFARRISSETHLIVAAISAAILFGAGSNWISDGARTPVLMAIFVWLLAVMVWCSFRALHHADMLAKLLGEPIGTLILTAAVITIEVSIIAAVMLNHGPNPTLARDTMFSVLIIVLNGMVGLALLIGGIRHREQDFNLRGARSYLSVVITLATLTLILPRFTTSTDDQGLTVAQGLIFSVLALLLYGTFLAMQTVRHREHFVEPGESIGHGHGHPPSESGQGAKSIAYHAAIMILTLLALVLLSKKLALIVDYSIDALGMPEALGGVVVAVLVLAPEGLAAIEAAAANHLQRAVNICLGSALATISLTAPAVIVIGILTGIRVELGLDMAEMVLLVLTLVISMLTFGAVRTDMLQGAIHLVVFLAFVVLIFAP
jgi:Ca2+:H+ antiporter